jgi:hypothetical protein
VAKAVTIGLLPYWASLTQWRQSGLGRLGRHDALLANGSLARLFWHVLDALDYWVIQARLSVVDAVYGPEPETEADRRVGVIGRTSRACSGLIERRGSPAAVTR